MKYCHTKTDVPKVKHYAIVIFGSYTVPGDERSRTNPGHGYPEHTEHSAEYIAFDNRAEWESEIRKMSDVKSYSEKNFVALVVDPASVTMQVNVNVKVQK